MLYKLGAQLIFLRRCDTGRFLAATVLGTATTASSVPMSWRLGAVIVAALSWLTSLLSGCHPDLVADELVLEGRRLRLLQGLLEGGAGD